MAAVLARGDSLIENAAREPEVADLATCLVRMGARIEGIDSSTMWVQGRDTLHSAEHTVLPDPHRDGNLRHGGRHHRRRRASTSNRTSDACEG